MEDGLFTLFNSHTKELFPIGLASEEEARAALEFMVEAGAERGWLGIVVVDELGRLVRRVGEE